MLGLTTEQMASLSLVLAAVSLMVAAVSAVYFRSQARSQAQQAKWARQQASTAQAQLQIQRDQWEREVEATRRAEEEKSRKEAALKLAEVRVTAFYHQNRHKFRVANEGPAVARHLRITFRRSLDRNPPPQELIETRMYGDMASNQSQVMTLSETAATQHYVVTARWTDGTAAERSQDFELWANQKPTVEDLL